MPTSLSVPLPPAPTPPVTASPFGTALPTPVQPSPAAPGGGSTTYGLVTAPGVPAGLVEWVKDLAQQQPQLFSWSADENSLSSPAARLAVNQGEPMARWLFVPAVSFATVADGTTLADLKSGWTGGAGSLGSLIVDDGTAATLTEIWGPAGAATTIVAPDALVAALWAERPAYTILPFERLTPELKVLELDGQSPFSPAFEPGLYPLSITVGAAGDGQAIGRLKASWPGPIGNYDPGRISRVAMTGVTALGRATAYQMEINGITTPGQVVGPVLQAADIAHISHEAPFASDCPYPNPIGDPIFCARDGYLALIQSIGTDVVELTGNHVNDWGLENTLHTMDLYEAAGLKTFGGGRNLAQALEPALFEHNGNKIAFVGCNPVGPAFAWAGEASPGSRPCDYPAFYDQIRTLREAGYFVIATLQYAEFYQYAPTGQQQVDFRALVDAGAGAVSGSQGHHAQGFELYKGGFIHYGLGNLFFDQMEMLGTRQSFIDTYLIYDGRLLSVVLYTSLIENYCCPREMSPAERAQVLEAVFQASGW